MYFQLVSRVFVSFVTIAEMAEFGVLITAAQCFRFLLTVAEMRNFNCLRGCVVCVWLIGHCRDG